MKQVNNPGWVIYSSIISLELISSVQTICNRPSRRGSGGHGPFSCAVGISSEWGNRGVMWGVTSSIFCCLISSVFPISKSLSSSFQPFCPLCPNCLLVSSLFSGLSGSEAFLSSSCDRTCFFRPNGKMVQEGRQYKVACKGRVSSIVEKCFLLSGTNALIWG